MNMDCRRLPLGMFKVAVDSALPARGQQRFPPPIPRGRIKVAEASHPVPDLLGREAARGILQTVSHLGPEDLVLVLNSVCA
jgi:hypothetical protein